MRDYKVEVAIMLLLLLLLVVVVIVVVVVVVGVVVVVVVLAVVIVVVVVLGRARGETILQHDTHHHTSLRLCLQMYTHTDAHTHIFSALGSYSLIYL